MDNKKQIEEKKKKRTKEIIEKRKQIKERFEV